MKEKGDSRDDPMNNPADTNPGQRSGIDLFAGDRNAIVDRAYGTPDVARSRQAMVAALAIRPGEAIIEIGSGPGYMTVDMAAAAGPAGQLRRRGPRQCILRRRRYGGVADGKRCL